MIVRLMFMQSKRADRLPWLLSGAVALLVLTHLLTAHVSHAMPVSHPSDHESGTHRPAFETHPHRVFALDLDSIVTDSAVACPIPRILGQRFDQDIDLAPTTGLWHAGPPRIETTTQVAPVCAALPRPPGPDRQAILQRFTL